MNQFVKLNLKYVYPKSNIGRTVVVPQDWTLAFLHEVIQQCFPQDTVRRSRRTLRR